ncbi:uncharacterized protein M421DRAFT_415717 [Didymella exigua CBS 183.55]|uniref:Uncharacterized protein n=1 Tax=Didymella exigua CBS 183.55 TaxID=1150837 RepID=A0A6A5S790_9PLEO|nr:uncharacterized protein M421DRAFT_415717 [Didymella exigua CBS 183.55]KAF1933377.1 hypothetical protein M421DRAFT_415717 [Didymella exigua CBS 183.55]
MHIVKGWKTLLYAMDQSRTSDSTLSRPPPIASPQVSAHAAVLTMQRQPSELSSLARPNGRVSPDPSPVSALFTFRISVLNSIRLLLVQHRNICSTLFASPDPLARPISTLTNTADRHRHAVSDIMNITLSR